MIEDNRYFEYLLSFIEQFDAIDSYNHSLIDKLTNVNHRISDLEHMIENNKLNTAQCYRAINHLRILRKERRNIKNNIEIFNVFKDNQNKIFHPDNRKMFISQLNKIKTQLETSAYKNRVYSEEELESIIGN